MNIIAKTEEQKKFAEKMISIAIRGLRNIEIQRGENNEFSKLSKIMREYLENYNGSISAQDAINIGKALEKYNTDDDAMFFKAVPPRRIFKEIFNEQEIFGQHTWRNYIK